jgi:hypothetical protein
VPQSRSSLRSALVQLSDCNRALRLRLEENENLISRALAMLSENVTVSAVLQELPVYAAEIAADEAMMALFEARDRVRKVVICEALDDGMSVEQLAAMFHRAPDLISSYVAERSNRFEHVCVQQSSPEGAP